MKQSFLNWMKITVFSFVVAAESCVLFLLSVHLEDVKKEIIVLAGLFVAIATVVSGISHCRKKTSLKRMIVVPVVLLLSYGIALGGVFAVYGLGKENGIDTGKEDFFSNKNVMIIVPHQDDEVLLSGGIIEEYIHYGSDVKIVFTTAGDYSDIAEWRMEEAISVAQHYGIEEKGVIFLGYGNEWNGDYHIYNAKPNTVMESANGLTETYATETHKAYRDGTEYTRDNFKSDIKSVLLDYKPNVIYCIDYDAHADHRATSLLFEEAMGEILKEQDGYKPIVYKGFAYSTSLYAVDDYAEYGNSSTADPYDTEYMQENNVYNWSDRVRLPILYSSVTNNIRNTSSYKALELYASQTVINKVGAVENGDRVYWERNTNSLLYRAEITTSSQSGECLTDFKLCDSTNIRDFENIPTEGVWVPTDSDKTIQVTLNEKTDISNIVLYDNPSLTDNVSSVKITFDDNTEMLFDDIAKNGSKSVITVNKNDVKSFSVQILAGEGDKIGFTEIEAFSGMAENTSGFIKLLDSKDNFVYDYYFSQGQTEDFSLYTYCCEELTEQSYKVTSENKKIKVSVVGDVIRIECPENEKGKIFIQSSEGSFSDTIFVFGQNSGKIHKASLSIDMWLNREFNLQSEKRFVKKVLK